MPEEVGIKETKELLVALGDISSVIAKAVKGGGTASEISSRIAAALIANPSLIEEVKAAADGISAIPSEIKDLTLGEVLELCEVSLVTTRKALTALSDAQSV
jgi:hypothetical protein